MGLGINADPMHPEITSQLLIDSKAQSCRMVLGIEPERLSFADQLHRASVQVVGILTLASVSEFPSVEEAADWYHSNYQGSISVLQLGNEPETSELQSPDQYIRFVYEALAGWGRRYGIPVWSAGLASGNPAWLDPIADELVRVFDAIAIHPYGQSPDGVIPAPFGRVDGLIAAYRRFQLPIVCSEWGPSSDDYPDDSERARYISAMISTLAGLGVDSQLFCLSTLMHPKFGILNGDDGLQESELYAAFRDSFP